MRQACKAKWPKSGPCAPITTPFSPPFPLVPPQVYAPLGHALGLGAVSANMEDACFRVGGWVGDRWVGCVGEIFHPRFSGDEDWLHGRGGDSRRTLLCLTLIRFAGLEAPRCGQRCSVSQAPTDHVSPPHALPASPRPRRCCSPAATRTPASGCARWWTPLSQLYTQRSSSCWRRWTRTRALGSSRRAACCARAPRACGWPIKGWLCGGPGGIFRVRA